MALLAQHLRQLEASGLNPTTIAASGLESLTDAAEAGRRLGWAGHGPVPSLSIPHFVVGGERDGYVLRPDTPHVRKDGRAPKYERAIGVKPRPYAPPFLPRELYGGAAPLIFTEGEKKALKLAQTDPSLAVIGLAGVTQGHDVEARRDGAGYVLHADILALPLMRRVAYIVFDSDVVSNPHVLLAEAQLARMLLDQGMDVRLVRIPSPPGGGKAGIDDHLAQEVDPAAELHRLLDAAAAADPLSRVRGLDPDDELAGVRLLRDPAFIPSLRVLDRATRDVVTAALRGRKLTKAAVAEYAEAFSTRLARSKDEVEAAWPEPVSTARILDELVSVLEQFVVLPAGAATAIALWILHTYVLDAVEITPRLAIVSPTMRCGKSTLLRLLRCLVHKPFATASTTSAVVFRVIEKRRPTLLIDEADSFLDEREELRGIVNEGHHAGGVVTRCVGDEHDVCEFKVFAPVALAAIRDLPRTILDRSLVISMRRKAPSEKVERFVRAARRALEDIPRKALRWARDCGASIATARPIIPESLNDRQQDNWDSLLAISELAGKDWSHRARQAALALAGAVADVESELGVELLVDLKRLFATMEDDRIPSQDLLKTLHAMEGRPWNECSRGSKPLTDRHLAVLLKPFGVLPRTIRIGNRTPKGYCVADLADAFARYLSLPPLPAATSATQQESQENSTQIDPQQGASVADSKWSKTTYENNDVAAVALPAPGGFAHASSEVVRPQQLALTVEDPVSAGLGYGVVGPRQGANGANGVMTNPEHRERQEHQLHECDPVQREREPGEDDDT